MDDRSYKETIAILKAFVKRVAGGDVKLPEEVEVLPEVVRVLMELERDYAITP